MHSTQLDQPPRSDPREARWVIFPSLPTTRLIRSNSFNICSLRSKISFSVSATLPAMPTRSTGIRTEKSPRLKAVRTLSSSLLSRPLDVETCAFISTLQISGVECPLGYKPTHPCPEKLHSFQF